MTRSGIIVYMADERWDELKEHFKTNDELCDYAEKYAYELEDAAIDAAYDELNEELGAAVNVDLEALKEAASLPTPDFVGYKAGLVSKEKIDADLKLWADAYNAAKRPKK